jgi:hypothetical protein
MSSFFNNLAKDFSKFEQSVLGPDYKYYRFINTPKEMGMSSDGNMGALARDVAGLVNYTKLMIEGTGPANKAGNRPLGNKFFLKTGGQCKASDGSSQDRYIYINNVPNGSIPFLSSAMGENFSEFRGLVPGAIGDATQMNPLAMMSGFMQGKNPECTAVSLSEINSNNQKTGRKTRYIANGDILQMDPCTFGGRLPIPNPSGVYSRKSGCVESFVGSKISNKNKNFANVYTLAVSGLIIYILYKLHNKN